MTSETKPLNTVEIFRESIKLPAKNRALILPIFLLYLLFSYALNLFNHLTVTPLLNDLALNTIAISAHNYLENPKFYKLFSAVRKDIRELIIVELIFLVIAFAISCVLTIATIHVLACTYARIDNLLTPKDVLSKVRRTFKGPMVTQLYIGIFNFGYLYLALAWAAVMLMFYEPKSLFFSVSSAIQALILLLLLSNLATVWFVSVVISVVEGGCYGLVAIGRAAKLLRGKRMQGTFIIFILIVVKIAMHGIYYYLIASLYRSPAAILVCGFIFIAIDLAMSMIVWATSVVFCNECVRIHGEVAEISMDGRYTYSSLSANAIGLDDEEASLKLVTERC